MRHGFDDDVDHHPFLCCVMGTQVLFSSLDNIICSEYWYCSIVEILAKIIPRSQATRFQRRADWISWILLGSEHDPNSFIQSIAHIVGTLSHIIHHRQSSIIIIVIILIFASLAFSVSANTDFIVE